MIYDVGMLIFLVGTFLFITGIEPELSNAIEKLDRRFMVMVFTGSIVIILGLLMALVGLFV